MSLFKSMTETEALDRELERLHAEFGQGDKIANGILFKQIKEIETLLIDIARKNNGMEW